jgi:hypothetical protein
MRNSLLPLAALIAVVIASLWLVRGGAAPGVNGPEIFPGIFRFPAKEARRVAPMALSHETAVDAAGPAVAASAAVVLLSGLDTGLPTRVALLGLAEEITRRGGIAVLDPAEAREPDPLPLGADWRVAVGTVASAVAAEPLGECSLTVAVHASAVVPGGPAARWLPGEAAPASAAFQVVHRSRAAAGAAGGWPARYAGIGNALAGAVCARLGLAAACPDPGVRARANAWEGAGRIPQPPGADELRWQGAFQFPLVRGWVGAVEQATTTNRTGAAIPALQPLLKRLARGGWQGQLLAGGTPVQNQDGVLTAGGAPVDPGQVAWVRDHDGLPAELRFIPAGTGWRLELWQVRAQPAQVVQQWRESAAAGDAAARTLLERHRATVGIPADLRQP